MFGEGTIVEQTDNIMTIQFQDGERKFVYPDAIGQFIELKDESTAEKMTEIIQTIKKEREEEKEEARIQEEQLRGKLNRANIHESSQIVFWLNEDEQADIFDKWEVFSGTIQSGKNKGNPNRPARLQPNSAALLTVRSDEQAETERKIIGLYMVHETLTGSSIDDGIVMAHDRFRIQLTDEEAEKMLFWNYYINRNYPHRTTWNSGKYRYYDNIWTAQILEDLLHLRKDEEEKEEIEQFLQYFCNLNGIDPENIPAREGALLREEAEAN